MQIRNLFELGNLILAYRKLKGIVALPGKLDYIGYDVASYELLRDSDDGGWSILH